MGVTAGNIGTWVGLVMMSIALVTVAVRVSNLIAVAQKRLDNIEDWIKSKSINRSELEAVERAASAGRDNLKSAIEVQHKDFDGRFVLLERKFEDNSKVLMDVRLDVAKIPEHLRRQDDLQGERQKATEHSIAGLKQILYGMARAQGVNVPMPADIP